MEQKIDRTRLRELAETVEAKPPHLRAELGVDAPTRVIPERNEPKLVEVDPHRKYRLQALAAWYRNNGYAPLRDSYDPEERSLGWFLFHLKQARLRNGKYGVTYYGNEHTILAQNGMSPKIMEISWLERVEYMVEKLAMWYHVNGRLPVSGGEMPEESSQSHILESGNPVSGMEIVPELLEDTCGES